MTHRLPPRFACLAALIAIVAAPHATAPSGSARAAAMPAVVSDVVDVPVVLELTPPAAPVSLNQTISVQGRVTAQVALANVRVIVTTEGSARLQGISTVTLGAIGANGVVPFSVAVVYGGTADAAVKVKVIAEDAETHVQYQKNDGVYSVYRGGKFRGAVGDYVIARMKAIQADQAIGLISPSEAAKQLRVVRTLPVTRSQSGAPHFAIPAELQRLAPMVNTVINSGLQNDPLPSEYHTQNVQSGNVTYHGNISWLDSNANPHAAFGMRVVLYQTVLGIPINTASTTCDLNGDYSVNGLIVPLADTYIEIQTENNLISLQAMSSGGFYAAQSNHHNDPPNNSDFTENLQVLQANPGPAAGLLTCDTYEAGYLAGLNGSALAQLRVEWPGSSTTAFYSPSLIYINLRPLDRWAYDVANHEYGHYVMHQLNFQSNPGGPHNIGACISNVQSSKDKGNRLAWGEGWPTYFGTSSQVFQNLSSLSIPTLGDVIYTDTEAGNFNYSLEANSGPPSSADNNGRGEDNEIAVQRILWDMVDGNSDSRDNTAVTPQSLFNLFKNSGVTTLSAAWALVRGSAGNNLTDLAYGAITTDHMVGPQLTAPANAAVVSPSANKTFNWNGNVGCPSSYTGDGYVLHFYKTDGTSVLTISGLTSATRTITNGELGTLIAGGHNLLWAVEGSNSTSPATGPYLGENRTIQVDNPPVANAGTDQTVECTSTTTTTVQLDGSGSSDPDGDALTYTWSATGITFSDIHAQKPTGQFPEGTTTVTLTVSDGILTDTDQVDITVVDTTPPVVSCPTDLTLECNSHCDASVGGVPDTDADVVAWLALFTATDLCDANPTTTLPHPACFPLGDTEVTFTAKDASGNTSTCKRTVHVIDTTPPEITMALDRTALWPPNHKMVTINATVGVTDVCDPHPFFQLWSITSSEPVNSNGDGNTSPDIAGADYGTADTQFQLRAERRGPGDGRIYTVVYRAFDHSGNHSDASAEVKVAHDQSLAAQLADGWNETGTGFKPGAEIFALVIRTIPTDAVEDIQVGGDLRTGDGGQAIITPADAFVLDANMLRAPEVGNTVDALEPVRLAHVDVDGDGHQDLVTWYRVADALAIRGASDLLDGPVGLHVMSAKGDFLAENIFALGTPVVLPPIPVDEPTVTNTNAAGTEGAKASAPATAPTTPTPTTEVATPPAPTISADRPAPIVLPTETAFLGVYPNPVPGRATVAFNLSHDEVVQLAIYNVAGARVRTLQSGTLPAGRYSIGWDGRDEGGRTLTGGVYFVRFSTGRYLKSMKTVLMR